MINYTRRGLSTGQTASAIINQVAGRLLKRVMGGGHDP